MAEPHSTPRKPSFQDLTGQHFGQLVVLEWDGFRNSYTYWKCRCEACGNTKVVTAHYLKKHRTGSCGCLRRRKVDVTCETCGKVFKAEPCRTNARFCSRACMTIGKPGRKAPKHLGQFDITCHKCGKTFKVPFARKDTARYCSRACKNSVLKPQVARVCERCNKTFYRYASTLAHGNHAGRFCSRSCWRLATSSAVHHVFLQGKCNRCGWCVEPDILTIHHIDRNRKNNTVENLELLCFTCHFLEHYRAGDGPFWHPGPRTRKLRKTRLLLAKELLDQFNDDDVSP